MPPASAAAVPAAWIPTWREVRLRRDGAWPLRFAGCLIARHDGQVAGSALWHDLALYRVAPDGVPAAETRDPTRGGYAVEIVAQHAALGRTRPASCHAVLCATLDEALTRLESHDASRDVCPGISAPALALDDPAMSACALALRAAALRGASLDALRRYRIGVGAFLANLGLRDL